MRHHQRAIPPSRPHGPGPRPQAIPDLRDASSVNSAVTARCTYGGLLQEAAERILDAQDGYALDLVAAPGALEAVDALRDLTAALAYLGRTILRRPPVDDRPDSGTGPLDALLDDLECRGRARPWDAFAAGTPTAATLCRAAVLTRAAGDLWSTHYSTAGAARSPAAARLQHPSALGAALRGWRDLVCRTSVAAEALVSRGRDLGVDEMRLLNLAGYPHPVNQAQVPTRLVVGVARPPVRVDGGLSEAADRVMNLTHLAWTLAEQGIAPVVVQRNLAALAETLCRAAATAHRAALAGAPAGEGPEALATAEGRALTLAARWRAVQAALAPLRTLNAWDESIQLERMDLSRLLEDVAAGNGPLPAGHVAAELSRAMTAYCDVARYNHKALARAHRRGDVYVMGHAIPGEVIAGNGELLHAKLADLVVPAPNVNVRHAKSAYRAVLMVAGAATRVDVAARAA